MIKMKTVKKAIKMNKRTMKTNLSLARFSFTLAFNSKQITTNNRTLFGKTKIMTRLRSNKMMTSIKRKKKPSLESIVRARMSTG